MINIHEHKFNNNQELYNYLLRYQSKLERYHGYEDDKIGQYYKSYDVKFNASEAEGHPLWLKIKSNIYYNNTDQRVEFGFYIIFMNFRGHLPMHQTYAESLEKVLITLAKKYKLKVKREHMVSPVIYAKKIIKDVEEFEKLSAIAGDEFIKTCEKVSKKVQQYEDKKKAASKVRGGRRI